MELLYAETGCTEVKDGSGAGRLLEKRLNRIVENAERIRNDFEFG